MGLLVPASFVSYFGGYDPSFSLNALVVILRDLRRLSRHSYTFWGRAVFGALAFLGLWGTALAVDYGFVSGIIKGKAVLWLLAQLLLFLCAIAGVVTTSDSLSEERREGTLGLLFLTPLRPLELLCGRLAAASVTLVYRFVAVIPIVGLTMLFGGVTFGEFARLAALLLNALLLSLVIGLFVSCVAKSPRVALTTGFFITGLVYLGPFVFWGATGILGHRYFVNDLVPVLSLSPIFGLAYSGCLNPWAYNPNYFQWSLVACHSLAWLLFWSGALLLKRSVRSDGGTGTASRQKRQKGKNPGLRDARSDRTGGRSRFLDVAPYSWLMIRQGNARARVEGYLIALLVIGGLSLWKVPDFPEFGVLLLCFAIAFVKLWLLIESATRISDERSKGSFELLLSSPLGVNGVIRGINRALWRQFGRAVIALLAVAGWLYFSLEGFENRELRRDYRTAFLPVGIGFLVDLWALKWAGMWSALKAKGSSRAYLVPLSVIFVVPWVSAYLIAAGITVYRDIFRISEEFQFADFLAIWAWCSFPLVIAYGLRARYQFVHRTWALANHGFDYASAESEWIAHGFAGQQQRKAKPSFVPWPKTLRRQVWASLGVLLVGLFLLSQGRRMYFERQFKQSLVGFPIAQEPFPLSVRGVDMPNLGRLPSAIYDAAVKCVHPQSIVQGNDLKAIAPAIDRAPVWKQSYTLSRRLEVLGKVLERNAVALSELRIDRLRSSRMSSSESRALQSWNEVQVLMMAFDVVGCEIYQGVLTKDFDSATAAFMSVIRVQDYLVAQDSVRHTAYRGAGGRLDPWLRLLLSVGALEEGELAELESTLRRMLDKTSRGENVSRRMRYLAAYYEQDVFSGLIRQDFDLAMQRLLVELRRFSGKDAREWSVMIGWAEEFVHAVEKLDEGDPSMYLRISESYRNRDPNSNSRFVVSTSDMVSSGFVREMDSWIAQKARLRMMLCAVALERERMETGQYPFSLFETSLADSGDVLEDPYSGEPFVYTVTDKGYRLATVPTWGWRGRGGSPMEWRIPVSAVALGDAK